MSRPRSARWQAERAEFTAFLAGDRTRPLLLPRHDREPDDAYCVCAVLFITVSDWLRFHARYVVAALARMTPLSFLKIALYRALGMRIGRDVYIAPGVFLDPVMPELIELADDAFLGMECRLLAHEYTATGFRLGRVRVGRGAVVGAFATVRSGVSIGAEVTVGCSAVVTRDVANGLTVAGVPARPLPAKEMSA
jgi:acetyltransferase-like isoleucine patch superfamily enzyme